MTLKRCPRCNRVFSTTGGAGNNDYVHDCNSGNPTLDNEDIFNLSGLGWSYRGIANKASIKAQIEGEDTESFTNRGVRTSTHLTRKHFEYIELK